MIILDQKLDPGVLISVAKLAKINDHLRNFNISMFEQAWDFDACVPIFRSWNLFLDQADVSHSLSAPRAEAAIDKVVSICPSETELSDLLWLLNGLSSYDDLTSIAFVT